MSSLDALFAGEEPAVDALLSTDTAHWVGIARHAIHANPASPAFVRVLWKRLPNIGEWQRLMRAGLDQLDHHLSRGEAREAIFEWIRRSVLEAFPETHVATIAVKIADLNSNARNDGGFSEAKALFAQLDQIGSSMRTRAQVALLVVKGATTLRQFDEANQFALKALESFSAVADRAGMDLAKRHHAGALLQLRHFHQAFTLFDDVLRVRGPLFGGGGVTVFTTPTSEKENALDEVQTIATWASQTVPEWTRAVGCLAELFADEPIGATLQRRYAAALMVMVNRQAPVDDFEVVIRQASERGGRRTASLAAEAGLKVYPVDDYLRSKVEDVATV